MSVTTRRSRRSHEKPEAATTTLGALSFSRFVLSAASPLIAGGLYGGLGIGTTYYYIASLFALAAVVLLVLPLKPRSGEEAGAHRH